MHKQHTVHILLATYNGAQFIDDQLQSIARQTHSNWTLIVSDDGSTDDTLSIIQRFAAHVDQQVTILQGPGQGSSTANFCYLLKQAPTENLEDLYAFCDQDDVWHNDKLQRAVQFHSQHRSQYPRLYCGRTQYANEKLQPIGFSPEIKRSPSFGNALVQNIASGNTMVFNHAVLLAQKKIKPTHSVWHDWTTYIVATAIDGLVWFDHAPCLLYRQHSNNVIGSNNGLKAQISRFQPLAEGRFKKWTDLNIQALDDLDPLINLNAKKLQNSFIKIRAEDNPWKRLYMWSRTEIRRQSLFSNLTLGLAIFFKLV